MAAPLYADLAAARMELALVRLALKAGYNPSQPRVPAVNSAGGQWTDAGGANVIPVAVTENSFPRVDLLKEEQNGGHTISEHVGKSANYLLNRVNQKVQINTPYATYDLIPERAGSFPSAQAAEKLVNSTLAQNPLRVSLVANGLLTNDFVTAVFSSKTGIEAFRPSSDGQPYIRDTYGVGVVIKHDASNRGFRIVTAYPRNDR